MIGYELFESAARKWRIIHRSIIPFYLPHHAFGLDRALSRRMVRERGCFLMRWESSFDLPFPTEWWHIIKDDSADIATLPKKTRYQVRQGLGNFLVTRCTREDILEWGFAVYAAAFERYTTFEPMLDEAQFRTAILEMPGNIEYWGVIDASGKPWAFAENVVDSEGCFYSSMWFVPEALKKFAAYGLVHTMNEHYLVERGLRYVSDGARNLSHATNIHEFLQDKFRFRKAYAQLEVEYAPLVGIVAKVFYPLREFIARVPALGRLSVLLEQERILRSFRKSGS